MKEQIVCEKCGCFDDVSTAMKGPHLGAWCNGCGEFIKWLPQSKETIIHFGKYKGRELSSMKSEDEKKYLMWVVEQDWCKNNLADKIELHLDYINGKSQ